MSALDSITSGRLIHKGGEACIYEVWIASQRCMLKWYNRGYCFEKKVIDILSQKRIRGVYHIIEFGLVKSHAYLLYDCVDGICSNVLLPIPVTEALLLLRKLTNTLEVLQGLGISHGDLNPANVIFDADANPILIDFGIVGPGHLSFAARERFQGQSPNVKSDLYSLGMLLYSWITGESLVKANNFEEFAQAAAGIDSISPVSLLYEKMGSSLPYVTLNALEPLWKGLLRQSPDNRFNDFEEMDELIEIALKKIDGGLIKERLALDSLTIMVRKKISETNTVCQNTNCECENRELPFRPKGGLGKKYPKWVLFLGGGGIVLLFVCIYFMLLKPVTDIDGTGAEIIQKSRYLEKNVPSVSIESSTSSNEENVKDLLHGLPLPMEDSSCGRKFY